MTTSMAATLLSVLMGVAVTAAVIAAAGHGGADSGTDTGTDTGEHAGGPTVRRVSLSVVPVAVVAVGAGAMVQILAGVVAGATIWHVMSIAYLDAVVGAPVVGAGLLLAGSQRGHTGIELTRPVAAVAVVCVLAAPLGWWASKVGPYRLQLDTASVELPAARAGEGSIQVGIISDIQTVRVTGHEREAVRRLAEASPDVVLVAGDIFQSSPERLAAQTPALRELFRELDAPGGLFVVAGDVDDPARLRTLLEGTPARLLEDEVVTLELGDRAVALAGVSLQRTDAGLAALAELGRQPEGVVRVVLGHRPDWVYDVDRGAADLVVSGHTHGGQVALPWFGPLLTLTDVPRRAAAGGLHTVAGTNLYVSTGVGREQQGAPQIRFLVDPSVAVIELR